MKPPKTLLLVRHGSLAPELAGRYVGSSDVPLSETGVAEAAALGLHLRSWKIDALLSSPMSRAARTADEIVRYHPHAASSVVPDLREIDFGRWELLTNEQIRSQDPALAAMWEAAGQDFAFPGGESLAGFEARVATIRQRLLDSDHTDLLLVTHGGVLRILLCTLLGIPASKSLAFQIDRGSLSVMTLFPNGLGTLNLLNFKPPEFHDPPQ